MHEIKIIMKKDCGNCEAMKPILESLSEELPIKFVDADTPEGRQEIGITGLPHFLLPLVNVDNRELIMGFHTDMRKKILLSLMDSPGINTGLPENIHIQEHAISSEGNSCYKDIDFDLKTGQKKEGTVKCSIVW